MAEPVARALLIGGVVAAVLIVAFVGPYVGRRRAERTPLDLDGLPDGALLFTASGCRTCDQMRAALAGLDAAFTEVRHEDDPGLLERVGVGGVPLLVVRDPEGSVVGRVAGRPSLRRLRRLLANASGE